MNEWHFQILALFLFVSTLPLFFFFFLNQQHKHRLTNEENTFYDVSIYFIIIITVKQTNSPFKIASI